MEIETVDGVEFSTDVTKVKKLPWWQAKWECLLCGVKGEVPERDHQNWQGTVIVLMHEQISRHVKEKHQPKEANR